MAEEYSIVAMKTAITETAGKLFSEGPLSDKKDLALKLSKMKGLDLFSTAVPWQIDLGQEDPILGFSETLHTAAKDIHAHLITLERMVPMGTIVTIGIDEARLLSQRQDILPLNKLERGWS